MTDEKNDYPLNCFGAKIIVIKCFKFLWNFYITLYNGYVML